MTTDTKYRIRRIYRSSRPGLHGWFDRMEACESLEDALAKMNAPMKNGCYEVQVYEDGKVQHIAKRRRTK